MAEQAIRPTKKLLKRKAKPVVTQPEDVAYPELENMLAQMYRLQQDGLENRNQWFALEKAVLTFLKERGLTSYTRGPITGTGVWPMGEDVDWVGIKKVLTDDQWKSILGEPQPVKSKLEALIELKQVKAEDIEPFVTEKPIKPSMRLGRKLP